MEHLGGEGFRKLFTFQPGRVRGQCWFFFHRIVLEKCHNELLRRGRQRPGCSKVQVLNAKLCFCLFFVLYALIRSV